MMPRSLATAAVLSACLFFASSCRLDHSKAGTQARSLLTPLEVLYFEGNRTKFDDADAVLDTALEAAGLGYTGILRYLHALGSNLNTPSSTGYSPLLAASMHGHLDTVRFLVEQAGADIRAKTPDKLTCLMVAVRGGYRDLCLYFLDRGANVNGRTDLGVNSLMLAAAGGSIDLVALLIERGANIHAKDGSGKNAADHARTVEVQKLLGSHGLVPGAQDISR